MASLPQVNNNSYDYHNILYLLVRLNSLSNRDLPLAGLTNHKLFHSAMIVLTLDGTHGPIFTMMLYLLLSPHSSVYSISMTS